MVEDDKERILNLFDSYWYYKIPLINSKNPLHEEKSIHDIVNQQIKVEESKYERLPSLRVRSLSDHNLNSSSFKNTFYDSHEMSPSSVLLPKLQPILSGKEMKTRHEEKNMETPIMSREKKTNAKIKGRRKSYSELEFEEVKGFIDLGFVFSEEAKKNSILVSLVPGLQRFGEEEKEEDMMIMSTRQPYLSDAWNIKNETSYSSSAINRKVRRLSLDVNEFEMRDHLKNWAHTVASRVK